MRVSTQQQLAVACAIALVLVLVLVLADRGHASERFCAAAPAPEAVSEAKALSRLGAVPHPHSGGDCVSQNPEAENDRAGLRLLGWQAAPPDDDLFAQHRLVRGKNSASGQLPPSSNSRLRMDTMRENFGGPPAPGYGWSPSAADAHRSADQSGWHDHQSVQAAACADACTESRCRIDCAETALGRVAASQHAR